MCTGLEPLIVAAVEGGTAVTAGTVAAGGITATGALTAASAALSAASALKALTASGPKVLNPEEERAKADAKAAQDANSRLALRSKALASNSLRTGAPTSGEKTLFGG